jgi:hypothetical protein
LTFTTRQAIFSFLVSPLLSNIKEIFPYTILVRRLTHITKNMGLTLEFYMGDPKAIGAAVADSDFDVIDDTSVVKARADLSLHIQPQDLDSLSREAASLLRRQPILLQQSLGDAIGGDEDDHGAFPVASDWVSQIAALELATAPELTRRWMAAMARQYDDPGIQATPDTEASVSALITLCRQAVATSTPVIHAWFL